MNLTLARISIALGLMATLAVIGVPGLFAHHPEMKTSFRLDERTQVPGAMLEPAHTYVLKVLKSDTDRHVVQILNEDGNDMLTTFLGVSDRMSGNQNGFTFMEMQGDHKVVREWFKPEWGGLKFVYSEQEARDIAQHSREGVMWTRNKVTASTTDVEGIQVATMEHLNGSNAAEQVARNDTDRELPSTAGELPLLGGVGALFVAFGAALRYLSAVRS